MNGHENECISIIETLKLLPEDKKQFMLGYAAGVVSRCEANNAVSENANKKEVERND